MQLYAAGIGDEVLYAGHASKHKNYSCLECGQTVRVRSGFHRQPHFYHLQPDIKCRLNAKSMPHLMLQHYLLAILPPGEVQLEYRFSATNRIADVAWITQHLIFEVQCSPINAAEISQRNADYASQGYQVVWLLHQTRYNRTRITAAEDALHDWPHYFTDMNSLGEGAIYDQLSFGLKGLRQQWLPRSIVDVRVPLKHNSLDDMACTSMHLPRWLKDRLQYWPLHFSGDYLDSCLNNPPDQQPFSDLITQMHALEAMEKRPQELLDRGVWEYAKEMYVRWIAFPYRAILRLLLERAS